MRPFPRLCVPLLLSLICFSLTPRELQGVLLPGTNGEAECAVPLSGFEPQALELALAGWQQQAAELEAGRRRLAAANVQERWTPALDTAPREATEAEIDAVRRELELQGLWIPIEQIRRASRFWREGQPDVERAEKVAAFASLALHAAIGAGTELLHYYAESKLFGEPFTCRGAGKAIVAGAVLGLFGEVISFAKRLKEIADFYNDADDVIDGLIIANYLIPVFNDLFGQEIDPRDWANSDFSQFVSWASSFLGDAVWSALPCARASVGAICDLREIVAGDLGTIQSWIRTELGPCVVGHLGPGFEAMLQVLETEIMAQGEDPSDVPSAVGQMELLKPGTGTTVTAVLPDEPVDWRAQVEVSQPGSYTISLRLFRGNTFKGVIATDTATASSSPDDLLFTGTLDTSDLAALGGGEADYELRAELSNTTAGWTLALADAAGEPVRARFNLRQDRRPTIWMAVTGGQIYLLNFDLFIADPDGTRPSSVVLTFNGVDEDLTSRLPTSPGFDWAQGYHLFVNKPVPAGLHTARARVSDGTHTVQSGPTEIIRAGGIAYLQFPSVALTNVGEPAIYLVRVRDGLGGIPGADVYLSSNQPGTLQDDDGEAAARVVTGPDGWASFIYAPLATGRHVITVLSDLTAPSAISQTSNQVLPGCQTPDPPRLLSPSDSKSDVGGSVELEWMTSDGVSGYDIHLGTSSSPPRLTSVPAETGFDQSLVVNGLEQGRQYYWQVKAKAACDAGKVAESPVRTFFTLTAPGGVTLLGPADNATGLPTGLVLDWQNVTTPGATLYDLFFGPSDPPPFHADMHTRTEALVTGLAANTTYFWRVVARSAKDPSLVSQSPTWRFTTGSAVSTTVTLTAARDAGLRGGGFSNRNYGGQVGGPAEQRLFGLGNWDGLYQDPGAAPIRAVIAFDLSSIPAGSEIQNATLLLTPATAIGSQTQPLPIQIDPVTGAWSESSITWNNRPALDTTRRVNGVYPLSGFNPLQIGITSLGQSWMEGEIPNHGFQIAISGWESLSNHAKTFSQREDAISRAPQLTVTYVAPCQAPVAPGSPSPAHGAAGVSAVTLDWNDVQGAGSYKVYAGTSSPPPFAGVTTSSSFQLPGLFPGTQYWWRVEALASCDAAVASNSPTWTFTAGSCLPLTAPSLLTPSDGVGGQARSANLSWSAVPGAQSYEVLFDPVSPPVRIAGTTTGTSMTLGGLQAATTWSWRVRAVSTCDTSFSATSATSSFTTALAPRADAGTDRQIVSGGTTVLGGTPAASAGTPPYTYHWILLSGSGSLDATSAANPVFTAGGPVRATAQLLVTDAFSFVSAPSQVTIEVATQGLDFYALAAPCRVLDTRTSAALTSEVASVFPMAGTCGIPRTARAVAGNVTVAAPTAVGYLTVFPGDEPPAATSNINFSAGLVRANNLIVPVSDDGAGTVGLRAFVAGAGNVHVILDVTGYFE
jgi:hypothetical protein